MGFQTPIQVPVLDFSKENLNPSTSSWLVACKEVRDALETYGCFVIRYQKGSSLYQQNGIFQALEELFDLPLETKKKNAYDKPFHGYVGQIPFFPLYESVGIDDATTLHGTQSFTNLMWPNGNPHFCENVHLSSKLLKDVLETVTRMVFQSYGMGKYCESYIESTSYLLRLMKYRVPLVNETTNGFVTHTDKSFLTVLHQNEINGLELETKGGEWISFDPLPSSFLIIAGDVGMAWSNGRIHSPTHRVVLNGNRTRYSMALFSFFRRMVETPEELVDCKHPLRFRAFDHLGFLSYYYSNEGRQAEKTVKAINAYCGI